MATAAQVTMTGSSSSYLGESSRRTSGPKATPLAEARRQHIMRLGLQATIAVLLVLLGGGVVFWQTRRPDVPRQGAAPAPVGAAVPAAQPAPAASGTAAGPKTTAPGAPVAAVAVPAPGVPVAGAPIPGMAPARPKPAAKPGDAHITVASEPRCELLVDGVPYGATPLIDLAVPAGKHIIVLLNSSANVRETKKVALREGELWTRSFSFEGGKATEQNGLSAKMLAGHAEAAPAAKIESPAVAAVAPKTAAPTPVASVHPAAPAQTAASSSPSTAPKPIEGAASGGKPATAVASMAPPQKPRNVNARTLDSQQMYHPDPQLPAFVRSQRKGTGDARFAAKVCVGNDGRVYQVNVLSSIPGADDAIATTIKQWTYKPQPVSVCFVANIVYDLQ
jgi:hypothetical protein